MLNRPHADQIVQFLGFALVVGYLLGFSLGLPPQGLGLAGLVLLLGGGISEGRRNGNWSLLRLFLLGMVVALTGRLLAGHG